jgi:hypothetical protein
MGRVNPIDEVFGKLGLAPQSMLIVAGLSFIVGVMESGMTPFESPVYIGAMALTYAASVQWGLMDGVFVAAGTITLLLASSIFRADASLAAFIAELPADILLFGSLGVLPGLAVELFSTSTKEQEQERAAVRRKIAELQNKLMTVGKEKRAANDGKDDQRWNRRGNQLVDASRRMVAAESVTEVIEILSGTLEDALQPGRTFIAVANGEGGYSVSKVEPPIEADPMPIAAEEPIVKDLTKAGKPMTFPQSTPVGPDALSVNVLVPVILNKQLIAMIGLEVPEPSVKDELDFVMIVTHFAQEVSARFGLPA